MAWRIPTSSTTSGVNVDLSTTDNLYVSAGAAIGSTGGTAVVSSGSNQRVLVYGTVVAEYAGISLQGNPFTVHDNTVYVGPQGRVDGFSGAGIIVYGSHSIVGNAGYIYSDAFGIVLQGYDASTVSTINNAGTIEAGRWGIARYVGSTETMQTNNSGLIMGSEGAYRSIYTTAKDLITNTGKMIGEIQLDSGDDVYNGINGHQSGIVYGGDGIDRLYGGTEANTFHGDAGADNLAGYGGNDILYGDDGIDILIGGLGADDLYGGLNADQFVYSSISESTVAAAGRDDIFDFSHTQADKINLAAIDARSNVAGNNAFAFIGTAAFTGVSGQLHYQVISGQTYVSGDVNGDKVADFQIHLAGAIALTAADFVL